MPWSPDFKIDTVARTIQVVGSSSAEADISELCSGAFQKTIDAALAAKTFPILKTHSEMYKIMGANGFVSLERFAAPLFGIAGRYVIPISRSSISRSACQRALKLF